MKDVEDHFYEDLVEADRASELKKLREKYAGMAMQGLCTRGTDNICIDYYAKQAVRHADALINELGYEY